MLDSPLVEQLLTLALREDLALGDITSSLTIDREVRARGVLVAKQPLVVCGLTVIPALIAASEMTIELTTDRVDGDTASSGDPLATIEGDARGVLAIERTLLNVVQRLCSIATHTRTVTKRLKNLSLLDTRKTAPGFRMLDKYAVRVGGGKSHRSCLGDMILVKNNHVDCQSGDSRAIRMRQALDKVVAGKPPYMSFEVEVRDAEELAIALAYEPTVVMLDNFTLEDLKHALDEIRRLPHPPLVEVSGGITPERCIMLDEMGIAFVSMGSLTHSVEAVDISLRVERIG